MTRLLICTIGTSLLTNLDRPWAGWRPGTDLPDPEVVDNWLAEADPIKASAETNTLRALELEDGDSIALLHSDTHEGRFCAQRLLTRYQGSCRDVALQSINRLGYGADEFTTGLKSLVDSAIRLVRQAQEAGRTAVICATGGFKAEIALLNLLGALLEVEVVYIHELHRRLVRLPRLPLAWNPQFVTEHESFFTWIDEMPRPSGEVESWLKQSPQLRDLIEDGDDGNTYLTAAGDLLFKVARERLAAGPRAVWPEADPRPPEEKNGVSAVAHHRPDGWERFVARLCAVDCVSLVRYDAAAASGPRVRVLDGDSGVIGVCFRSGDSALPLRVETTARGSEQTEHVARYVRKLR
jgi:putative CRISPR-associated protein (TIGR02619 family)